MEARRSQLHHLQVDQLVTPGPLSNRIIALAIKKKSMASIVWKNTYESKYLIIDQCIIGIVYIHI